MIYLNVHGQHFVILNSLEVITDLFEKRSSNYSDRKKSNTMIELYVSITFLSPLVVKNAVPCRMGVDILSMSRMPYGLWWRKHRKTFHEYFHRNAVITAVCKIDGTATIFFLQRANLLKYVKQLFTTALCLIT